MNTRTAACAALLALAALTGCTDTNSSSGNIAACKTAMTKQFQQGVAARSASPVPTSTRPAACNGIDDATLTRLAGEVTTEWLDSDQAAKVGEDALNSITPFPIPTGPEIPAECRAWIEKELQDSTDAIDATAGSNACGDLSKEEMDQAIDTVTQDLIDASP